MDYWRIFHAVVIGLGKAGCNIAEMFKSYDNYKVLTYDGGKNVPLNESSEGYENGFPEQRELKKIKNETIWFFVAVQENCWGDSTIT